MNNRLKFRVWSVKNNCFVTNDCSMSVLLSLEYEGAINSKDIYQQYTGLNDKDNNPIFEGDLVELHTAANDHAKNIKENHYGLYEIYWDRKYKLKEIKPNWFFKVIDNDCASFNIMKVVGNVFNNPELLKTI